MATNATTVRMHRQTLNKIEKGLDKLTPGREVSLAKTAIQESIMFCGLVLGDIGEENPYPASHDKDSKVIEDRADVSFSDYNFDATDYVGQVKELRADIAKSVDIMKDIYRSSPDTILKPESTPFFMSHLITSLIALERSKMWLGMALNDYKLKTEKA
jgi:hypothetical protein